MDALESERLITRPVPRLGFQAVSLGPWEPLIWDGRAPHRVARSGRRRAFATYRMGHDPGGAPTRPEARHATAGHATAGLRLLCDFGGVPTRSVRNSAEFAKHRNRSRIRGSKFAHRHTSGGGACNASKYIPSTYAMRLSHVTHTDTTSQFSQH